MVKWFIARANYRNFRLIGMAEAIFSDLCSRGRVFTKTFVVNALGGQLFS
jgi:hypothetical protein